VGGTGREDAGSRLHPHPRFHPFQLVNLLFHLVKPATINKELEGMKLSCLFGLPMSRNLAYEDFFILRLIMDPIVEDQMKTTWEERV